MASFINLTLDTLPPQAVTLSINGGALYTNVTAATLTIGTSDTPTTGYQMKIWGGVTSASTEATATWEAFSASKSVTLTAGDSLKTVNIKLRDAVWNESAAVSASITLDMTLPIVTITGPDVSVISKITGKSSAAFSFSSNSVFKEYTVRVVPATTSIYSAGTQIPTTGGSTNMSGTSASGFPANTAINCVIQGVDLATAGGSDGVKIIKVFAKDMAGNWSNA